MLDATPAAGSHSLTEAAGSATSKCLLGYDDLIMLDPYVSWLLAGFALVIAELLTGTFYLLVLGAAAFAGGGVAWFGGSFWMQVLAFAFVAVAGMIAIHRYRKDHSGPGMPALDEGQPVTLESWINLPARHARVRYRDTLWDAFVEADEQALPENAGDVYYIVSMDGNTLTVARTRKTH